MKMDDLQLDLTLSNNSNLNPDYCSTNKKRSFLESFPNIVVTNSSYKRTLPLSLLIWDSNQIHVQGSAITTGDERSCCVDVEEDVTVGWPPVKSWMKKLCEQHRRECTAANYMTADTGGGGSDPVYVKVEMEGIGIARKIDLRIHHSYQSLTATLLDMFGKRQENLEMYKLTFKDKEGDWLLAGDVPWGRFVRSVRRLKLLRKDW